MREEITTRGKESLLEASEQDRIFSALALSFISRTASKMQQELAQHKSDASAAWNRCMADLVLCSKFHCLLYVFRSFVGGVQTAIKQGAKAKLQLVLLSWCSP